MIKILIVDDDEIIRKGLVQSIDWEKNNFQVVAAAKNGEEGLTLAKELRPQIIISDIRMPFMDGLQMTEKINQHLPEAKVILLTGYDDFEYAKKAINLKVNDYILKYADRNEILQAVLKAATELIEERNKRERAKKGNPLLRNKFLVDIISGIGSEGLINAEAELLNITFEGEYFCVAVIRIDDYTGFFGKADKMDMELAFGSILNVCEEIFSYDHVGLPFVNRSNHVNVIFNMKGSSDEEKERLNNILEDIIRKVKEFIKIDISVGIGGIYRGVKKVPISYNEAVSALELQGFVGNEKIISIEDIKNNTNSQAVILKRMMEYVDKNYNKENLSLADIADEVHITSKYVCTLFKKYKGINLSDYLIKVRIEKAKELLKNTDLKTYEIAERIGYSNPQHFSVLFKKVTGYTPTEYKSLS